VNDQVNNCQVHRRWQAENQICQERAEQRRAREAAAKSSNPSTKSGAVYTRIESPDERARLLKEYNTVVANVQKTDTVIRSARSFLQDPKRFIYDTLIKYSQDLTLKLFDPEGRVRRTSYADVDEIYKFVDAEAKNGFAQTQNPIIRAFQQTALGAIGQSYKRTTNELDTAIAAMHTFSVSETPSPMSVGAPVRSLPAPAGDVDCSILRDVARSRQLMQTNQAAWLDLVGRCK